MSEQLVPETDEQVEERMREMFSNISEPGFGGAVWALYQVGRAQGDSVKRAWVVAMSHGAGTEVPDYYLESASDEV